LESSGNGSSTGAINPPSETNTAQRRQNATAGGQAGDRFDLKTLVPLALVFLGIRGLVVAEGVGFPAWYDLLWVLFGSYMWLNRAERPAA
jgi:hypothetical protein